VLRGAEGAAERVLGPWESGGGSPEAPRRQDDGGPKGGEDIPILLEYAHADLKDIQVAMADAGVQQQPGDDDDFTWNGDDEDDGSGGGVVTTIRLPAFCAMHAHGTHFVVCAMP